MFDPFNNEEIAQLRKICPQREFIIECITIRNRFDRNRKDWPNQKPTHEAARYRAWRRYYERSPRGPQKTPPPLRCVDIVKLAIETGDPHLRIHDEPRPSPRAAVAFRQLENQPRSRTMQRLPELVAAISLRNLFKNLNLPFRNYQNLYHKSESKAATALRVILRHVEGRSVRHYIRAALAQSK